MQQQTSSSSLEDDSDSPVAIRRKKSTFANEAAKVVSWLDDDGDGVITDQELSTYLDISKTEAQQLIIEAKMQLYGQRPTKNHYRLTFQEFTAILASSHEQPEAPEEIPKRVLKRYRAVFDSIDTDRKGIITPAQMARDMGVDDLQGLGWEGKSQLTFDDFVQILRRAESGRAARIMTKLLEDKEQGALLADASEAKRKNTVIVDEPSAKVTQILHDIWVSADPTNDRAHIDNIRSSLLGLFGQNVITGSDDDLMQIILNLTSKANNAQSVSFLDFSSELQQYLEEDEEDMPGLRRGDSRSTVGWDNPSDTLSPAEYEMYRSLFDENDKDQDGSLQISELRELTMSLVEKQLLQPSVRVFYFQLLKMLDDSGEEAIDFEQFVVLMQEASESTSKDLNDDGWEALDAVSSMRMIQLKKSRHSKLRLKL
jgi:Ca2+-binding EF-hand superfamily protein